MPQTKSSNVVSLRGTPLPYLARQENPSVIRMLKSLMRRARAGEIQGCAVAIVLDRRTGNPDTETEMVYRSGIDHAMLFAVEALQYKAKQTLFDDPYDG